MKRDKRREIWDEGKGETREQRKEKREERRQMIEERKKKGT